MTPFTSHTGVVAALPRLNVDTDQIIPKQFLKRVERTGFGSALFYDWRYLADGAPNPAFELNQPKARGASILITGSNFGCGSSREHAPWALAEYGFRAIVSESFADIFFTNCCQNGLLPVRLTPAEMAELFRRYEAHPDPYQLTVSLERCEVRDDAGFRASFQMDPYRREALLQGLDEIGRTLLQEPAIAAYERRRAALLARLEG
ncbi:MAG TPA: 3-isopropylmalate dehydratase small subunit [Gemmatimonadales bacterium]|jgi:3-isopropylmalate/(R)-2-methylmalate dehydratase small subunit